MHYLRVATAAEFLKYVHNYATLYHFNEVYSNQNNVIYMLMNW